MKCRRVEFAGYKRLLDAKCNLDDRLIAFVGPNEAGKSSVLEGLAWMDAPDSDPLPVGMASRGQPPTQRDDNDTIIKTHFRLEPADFEALSDLQYAPIDSKPTYRLWKLRSGQLVHQLDPPLVRDPRPFRDARRALGRAPKAIADALAVADEVLDLGKPEELSPARALYESCTSMLESPDRRASKDEVEQLRRFSAWLEELGSSESKPTLVAAAAAVGRVADVLAIAHPNDAALAILDKRRPLFREFHRKDRDLESEVDITDESRELSAPFGRVLALAGTDESHLRQVWGDESERTLILPRAMTDSVSSSRRRGRSLN